MVLETLNLGVAEPDFWRKKFSSKVGKMDPIYGFLNLLQKFSHYFFLNVFCKERTVPVFGYGL